MAPRPGGSAAYVHPGRLVATAGAGEFTTVVGSGVVVCAWDPIANVAGMAHFLLPDKGNAPPAPRFGDVAMKQLLEELQRLGAQGFRLRAAVYGGSAPPIAAESGHLGERNVEAAKVFLATHGIAIVAKDVGGAGGRKVTFGGATGKVELVRLNG
ncbi:MAG TPA: chemotaxis protein CheD [Anaeromyxobacteraceae bacterium]|nr:chemotaxis protein CheD [Anaeromyxobacteraceae bacterium]